MKFALLSCFFFITASTFAQLFQEGFHIPSEFPTSAAFGDFNADGHIDMVQAYDQYNGSDPINANKIWLNNGDATFMLYDALGTYETGDVEVVDIDNDGDLDIIAGNAGNASNRIWLNDGLANFSVGQSFGNRDVSSMAVADFNEDGFFDVFFGVADIGTDDLFYLNDGDGTLSLVTSIPWTTGARTTAVEAVDINNDGHMDLVISRGSAPLDSRKENEVWTGFGDGTFFKSPQIFPFFSTWSMASGDYNGDGTIDLVFAENDHINGYLNDGSALFQNYSILDTQMGTTDVDLLDADNDGDLDLVIARFAGIDGFQSEVLFNDGTGSFTDGSEQFSTADTFEIEYVDIDQNGATDLFTVNKNNDDNVFWMNQSDPLIIEEGSDQEFLVFPNPSNGIVSIASVDGALIQSIELRTILGERLQLVSCNDTRTTIDMSALSSGVYLCTITSQNGKKTTKKLIRR